MVLKGQCCNSAPESFAFPGLKYTKSVFYQYLRQFCNWLDRAFIHKV